MKECKNERMHSFILSPLLHPRRPAGGAVLRPFLHSCGWRGVARGSRVLAGAPPGVDGEHFIFWELASAATTENPIIMHVTWSLRQGETRHDKTRQQRAVAPIIYHEFAMSRHPNYRIGGSKEHGPQAELGCLEFQNCFTELFHSGARLFWNFGYV